MFDDVDTESKRTTFFVESNAFIKPEKYPVGTAIIQTTVEGQIVPEPVLLTGTFISTRKVLQCFLELPGVLDTILSYMADLENGSQSDVMVNVVQGSLWKEVIKPKFGDKTFLPLTVSFDDFETNKDLGSHATVHKLSATHVSISCIPAEFASLLENMFLTLLYHTSDKAYGLEQVFRPLLAEFEYLEEEGIEVNVNGTFRRVYFALCLLVGDNLGLAFILGMVEGFTANFFCRVCTVHRDLTRELTYELSDQLRTKENYEQHLSLNDSSSTGIKVRCIWNGLKSFCISDNIYADVMHDIIEGVGNYDMCFVIEYLVEVRKLFDYNELNDYVQGFYFGEQEFGNKPPLISGERVKNEKLGFSASELLCLIRYFPLMIGDKIEEEENDPIWKFYLCLREIVDLLFAPTFSRSHIQYLIELIAEHHKSYLLHSKRNLRPKFHIMLHYGRIIKRVGPLKPISVMRSESKYKELRQAAHVTSSRKNISLTLATKASLKMCARFLDRRGLKCFVVSPYQDRVLISSLDGYENFEKILPVTDDGYCHITKWVTINGTEYKPGMVVVLGLGDFFPLFGTIHLVIIIKGCEAGLLVQEMVTMGFKRHLYAYEVQDSQLSDSYLFVRQKDLITFVPAHKRLFFDGKSYVMPRFAL